MTAFQESAVASRPLAALGINDMEECAYRALLARHAATAGEIAKQLAVSERLATTLLNSIETKGLATAHSSQTTGVRCCVARIRHRNARQATPGNA